MMTNNLLHTIFPNIKGGETLSTLENDNSGPFVMEENDSHQALEEEETLEDLLGSIVGVSEVANPSGLVDSWIKGFNVLKKASVDDSLQREITDNKFYAHERTIKEASLEISRSILNNLSTTPSASIMMKMLAIGSAIEGSGLIAKKSGLIMTIANTIDNGQAMATKMAFVRDNFDDETFTKMMQYKDEIIKATHDNTIPGSEIELTNEVVVALSTAYESLYKTTQNITHEHRERTKLMDEQADLINTLVGISSREKRSHEDKPKIISKPTESYNPIVPSASGPALNVNPSTSNLNLLLQNRASLLSKSSTGLAPMKLPITKVNPISVTKKPDVVESNNKEDAFPGKASGTIAPSRKTAEISGFNMLAQSHYPTTTITSSSVFHSQDIWNSQHFPAYTHPVLENQTRLQRVDQTEDEDAMGESMDGFTNRLKNPEFLQSRRDQFSNEQVAESKAMLDDLVKKFSLKTQSGSHLIDNITINPK
jgi:hypothetical protein